MNFTMSHPPLTEEQISVFQEVFALYDIDEDGTIYSADIPKVMKCLGCDFTKEELDNITSDLDPRGFGVINFQQFLVMMSRNLKPRPTMKEQCREVFKFFDVDEKGFINAADLRQAMINLGENLTEHDIKQMIKEAGIEEDGQVSYDEFVKIVVSHSEDI